jgi:hypothetical protein
MQIYGNEGQVSISVQSDSLAAQKYEIPENSATRRRTVVARRNSIGKDAIREAQDYLIEFKTRILVSLRSSAEVWRGWHLVKH